MDWLLENGGPVIRYRTATELLNEPKIINIEQLSQELIRSQMVGAWLERLGTSKEFVHLHSSKMTAYENAMGKLVQLGCKNGITPFDQKTLSFRKWLQSTRQYSST